jgi:GxxExxY protein
LGRASRSIAIWARVCSNRRPTNEQCLCHELSLASVPYERQKALPVRYKGIELQPGYRLDLVVDSQLLVELKAVERLLPVHEAQVITYLKLSGLPVGLLVNFHPVAIRHGLRRLTNNRTLPGSPTPCDPHDC